MAAEQVCIITSAGVRKCFDVTSMQSKVQQEPTPEPEDPSIGELIQIIRELLIGANYKKGEAAVVTVMPTIEAEEATAS
jgi:hypothetical protein